MNFTNLFSINLLAKTIIIEEVAQAKRSDGGVFQQTLPKGLGNKANNHQSPPPQAVPLLLNQEEDCELVFQVIFLNKRLESSFVYRGGGTSVAQ